MRGKLGRQQSEIYRKIARAGEWRMDHENTREEGGAGLEVQERENNGLDTSCNSSGEYNSVAKNETQTHKVKGQN